MPVIHTSGNAPQNVLVLALLSTKQKAHWLHSSLTDTVPAVPVQWPVLTSHQVLNRIFGPLESLFPHHLILLIYSAHSQKDLAPSFNQSKQGLKTSHLLDTSTDPLIHPLAETKFHLPCVCIGDPSPRGSLPPGVLGAPHPYFHHPRMFILKCKEDRSLPSGKQDKSSRSAKLLYVPS